MVHTSLSPSLSALCFLPPILRSTLSIVSCYREMNSEPKLRDYLPIIRFPCDRGVSLTHAIHKYTRTYNFRFKKDVLKSKEITFQF